MTQLRAFTIAATFVLATPLTGHAQSIGSGTPFAPQAKPIMPNTTTVLTEPLLPRCPQGFGVFATTPQRHVCARQTDSGALGGHVLTAESTPCNRIPNYRRYNKGPTVTLSTAGDLVYWQCAS